MTFPPCFSSSFAARPSSGIRANTTTTANNNGNTMSNMQLIELHQEDMVHQQWRSVMFSQHSIPSTRIFPDLLSQNSEDSKPEEDEREQECHQDMMNEEQGMEDNAARMLLELSHIVSKEVSADSGCIKRESIQDTYVHKNEEFHQISKDFHSPDTNDVSNSNLDRVSPCVTIPKSIEIHNHSTHLCSPLQSSTPSPKNSNSNNFEIFGPSSTTEPRRTNRYRTVSLAGDEMNMNHPEDQRKQLSPKLMRPLSSSPLPSKDLVSSFPSVHESPPRSHDRNHISRQLLQRHHSLLLDRKELEQEAIRRALVNGGPAAKAISVALAVCSAANVNGNGNASTTMITPDQPRPIISFHKPRKATTAQINAVNKDRERHFPLELPPQLLFNSNQKNPVAASEQAPKQVSTISVRSYNTTAKAKLSKRAASAAKSSAALAQKASKQYYHPYRNPRAKKKAKRNPNRKTHTGKKFSWKAYPELEKFLITNREEYLSFSAKNYTIEQRDYNNRLTSRLLDHAEASGYSALFESCAFSAVRDRIRSYYKSYVQSFKRRKERQDQQERLEKERLLKLEMSCR